ncbi:MAG: Flp pilus assembly protein CpaB [Desulfotomaculum sp. 46_296]|nr:MAG: Flp pilus assembly protein CpaB [Desulfotomaculum sp. 46_296]HAU32099.1 Flp pilus assembly protein CpaB [Desulfotomaculum sp.]
MKLINRWVFIIALVLAILAVFAAYRTLLGAGAAQKMIPVLVAAKDIPPNTVLTKDMLTIRNMPDNFAHPQSLHSISEAQGKTTKVQLLMYEQVLTSKILTRAQPGNRFSYHIPDKQRAVTVAVTEVTGVAGFPVVGDRVDVLLTRDSGGVKYTKTILQNKEILAAGGSSFPQEEGKQVIVPTITLSLTPAEAQEITLGEMTGKISLTLRPPVDRDVMPLSSSSYTK